MDLQTFYDQIKPSRVRLAGCEIYVTNDPGGRSAWRKLDGGRSVFVEKATDTTGLAVVSRQVVEVIKVTPVRWNVVKSLTEDHFGAGAA